MANLYLSLEQHIPVRSLRSSDALQLTKSFITGTFQYACAKSFNSLPEIIRNSTNTKEFLKSTKAFLKNDANIRL